jgi:hypothetical protein
MGIRAEALARRVEEGHARIVSFIENCSREDWGTIVPGEERTVGVLLHHVASVLPVELDLVKALAVGKAIEGVTAVEVNQMNAAHAQDNSGVTRAQTMALLKQNSAMVVQAIQALSDEELDRAAPVSLHWGAPVTTQYFIEDHPLSHSYHHLTNIQAALAG